MNHAKMIAIYARVSTLRQENEETIQTQLVALKDYADKNGYIIVQEYLEDGWSGDMLARPTLDQLRNDARRKLWEAVLIYDPDRIARRYSYQELIIDELQEAGVEVLFMTVTTPQNSEDKILHGVRGLFAQYERAKISERFRLGKLRKIKEGHLIVSTPLYGYTYILKKEREHGYYEINETEARVVKMIFSWVANEGLTLRKVIKRLQELGIKPKVSKREVWNTSTISSMLRNKGYIGQAHWGASYAVVPEKPIKNEKYKRIRKSSRRIKPESEWFFVSIPAIIDVETFEKVRAQLELNNALSQRNRKNNYLLAGKIWCTCGRRRTGEAKGKYLYYRCADRVLSFPLPRSCHIKTLNVAIADELVWQKISCMMSSPQLMTEQVERWYKKQENKFEYLEVDLKNIGKEIAKLKEQEDRYNKAYAGGLFTIEKLQEYTLPLKEQIKSCEIQISKSEQAKFQATTLAVASEEQIKAFVNEVIQTFHELRYEIKRTIIVNVIDKIVATPEMLQIYGAIPVSEGNNSILCADDYGRQGAISNTSVLCPEYKYRQDSNNKIPNDTKFVPFRIDIDLKNKKGTE